MALMILASLLLLPTLYATYHIISDPLRAFPGPFLARLTHLWRMYISSLGHAHLVNRKLHHEFGPAVRLGPNMISLSDVELITTLYANDEQYRKVSLTIRYRSRWTQSMMKGRMLRKFCAQLTVMVSFE